MTFENFELQEVLNYDSHRSKIFSFGERLTIHSAISNKMYTGVAGELPRALYNKIQRCLREMKETHYRPVIVRYELDGTDLIANTLKK